LKNHFFIISISKGVPRLSGDRLQALPIAPDNYRDGRGRIRRRRVGEGGRGRKEKRNKRKETKIKETRK